MISSKTKKRMKMLYGTIALCLLILLIFSSAILAVDTRNSDIIQVQKGETVKGPGFYTGNRVQIDGTVDGTAFAFGEEVRINGTINGDLVVAGRNVTINGKVLGNLYSGSQYLTVAGEVVGDAFGAAQNVTVAGEAVMQRDMLLAGKTIDYTGQVQRQLLAAGMDININGSISDDARLSVENLDILDKAVVGGDLHYESSNEAFVSGSAKVSGNTDWKKIEPKEPRVKQNNYSRDFLWLLWGLASSLLIWFLVAVWRPHFWKRTKQQIQEQPLKTLGIGVLGLIVAPILAVILMITLIGLPLGIILVLTYGVALYLAKIIVAVFIGSWLAERFSWPEMHKGVWLVLLGLAVIALLTKIPVLGFIIGLLVIFAGLGSVILVAARPGHSNGEI